MDVVLGQSRENLGKANRRAVLSSILLHGPLSRTELAQRIGLTNASISRIVREFLEVGLIQEGEVSSLKNRPGRRFINLHINPEGGRVLGISINALQQYVTFSNLRNQMIEQRELNFASLKHPELVLEGIAQAAQEILETTSCPLERIFGCGIAITGAVDPEAGVVLSAPTIGWEKIEVKKILDQILGIPIHVESIPNSINFAESRFGIVQGHRNVVVVNASLGIGSSLLLDNRLIRGHQFAAGLIGQSPFWINGKETCNVVDEVTGGWGILKELEGEKQALKATKIHPSQRLNAIMEVASKGNVPAQNALHKTGSQLGKVLATIVGLVHPECVVLSGPLSRSTYYVEGVQTIFTPLFSEVPLQISKMTSPVAARWLAINEFLIHRHIDLTRLIGKAS